jgi:hypothetical protein
MSRVCEEITRHFGWPFGLPLSSNFPMFHGRKARQKRIEAEASGALC